MKPQSGDFIIGDSSVLFCFEDGGLIQELFSLPINIAVSDMMFRQELKGEHAYLEELGLKVLTMSGKELLALQEYAGIYDGPSVYDFSALVLAKERDGILATGDGDLRNAAVRITGTLALTDLMLDHGIIDVDRLEAAYEAMRKAGDWLPWKEISKQLSSRRVENKKAKKQRL